MGAKEIVVKKYVVRLRCGERLLLATLIRIGSSPAQRLMKTRILLKAEPRSRRRVERQPDHPGSGNQRIHGLPGGQTTGGRWRRCDRIGILENFSQPERDFKKRTAKKLNPIATFRLLQIPALYPAPPCESAFAQTVNRTKMFHVKHFGTIRPRNRTKKPAYASDAQKRWIFAQASSSTEAAVA